jgi:hypothetical protein
MFNFIPTILSLLIGFFPLFLYAEKTLKLAAAYLPANMDNQGRGREADLVKSILACANYKVSFDIQPYSRHFVSYEKTKVYDAVITVPQNKKLQGYPTESHIFYQNGISYIPSLQRKNLSKLSDLRNLRVVSFVGAKNIIPQLSKYVDEMESYEELSRQDLHSKLLFDGKIDAVISDGLIFAAHNSIIRENHPNNPNYKRRAKFTASFPPNPFVVYFKNKKIRDDFNTCLKKLKINGQTKKIQNKYITPHKATLGNEYPSQ